MQIGNRAMLAVELMAWLRSCSRVRPGKTLWLADRIQHSVSYTEALLARLRQAGLVAAKKGAGGGYYLVKPAETTSVAEIMAVFDEPHVEVQVRKLRSSPHEAAIDPLPAVDELCGNLREMTMRFLETVTLDQVDSLSDGAVTVLPARSPREPAPATRQAS